MVFEWGLAATINTITITIVGCILPKVTWLLAKTSNKIRRRIWMHRYDSAW